MSMTTRYQRVFNHVFPPEESPFLSSFVSTEQFRPDQQRLWAVVTRVLSPGFSTLSGDVNVDTGISSLNELMVAWKREGREAWKGMNRSSQKAVETWYVGIPPASVMLT
jgi:hypothetical protein